MECPKCGDEITAVVVESKCTQWGVLDGNRVVSFDTPDVGDIQKIYCPLCDEELPINLFEGVE